LTAIALARDLEPGEDFWSALGGIVGDSDIFAIGGVILGEDAVQDLFDEVFVIMGVDENADEMLWHADDLALLRQAETMLPASSDRHIIKLCLQKKGAGRRMIEN
jgi:hypothetical protein